MGLAPSDTRFAEVPDDPSRRPAKTTLSRTPVDAPATDEGAAVEQIRASLGEDLDVVSLMRLLEPRAAVLTARLPDASERSDAQRQSYVDRCRDDALRQSSPPQPSEPSTAQSLTSAAAVELTVQLPGGAVTAAIQLSDAGISELVQTAYVIAGERGVNAARTALHAVLEEARVQAKDDAPSGGTPQSHEQGRARLALVRQLELGARRFEQTWQALETGPIRASIAAYQEYAVVAVLARLRAARLETEREARRYGYDPGFLTLKDGRYVLDQRRRPAGSIEHESFRSLKKLHERLQGLHAECSRVVDVANAEDEEANAEEFAKYVRALDVARRMPEHGTPEPAQAADVAKARSVIDEYLTRRAKDKEERRIAAFLGYMELRAAAGRAHPVLHRIAERPAETERDLERTVAVQLWRVYRSTRDLETELLETGGRRRVWKHAAVFNEVCTSAGFYEGDISYRAVQDRLQKGDRSFVGDLLDLSATEDAVIRGLSLGLAGLLLGGLTMGSAWAVVNALLAADGMLESIVTHRDSMTRFTSALDTAKALSAEAPSEADLIVSLVFDLVDLVVP